MKALLGLLRKEVYHILRDRRTLVVIIALPIFQVVLFGYAIRTDVDRVRVAIVDTRPDPVTLSLRSRLDAGGVFRTVAVLPRIDLAEPLFARGTIQGVIAFEPGFAELLARGQPAQLLVIADATEPNTGSLVQGYATAVVQSYASDVAPRRGDIRIVPSVRTRFNPTRESSNLFVP